MDDSPCKERNFKMKFRVSYLIGGEVLIFVHSYNVPCRFRRKITFCLRLPNGHVFLGTLANMDIRYDLTIWSRRNSASLFVSHRPSWMNSPTFTNFYFRINGLVSENLSKSTLSNPIIPPEKKLQPPSLIFQIMCASTRCFICISFLQVLGWGALIASTTGCTLVQYLAITNEAQRDC